MSVMMMTALYNVSGIKVRNAGESRNGLSKGIYLMKNGKKAVIQYGRNTDKSIKRGCAPSATSFFGS